MERFTVSASTNGFFSHRRQTAAFNSSVPISLPYKPCPTPTAPDASFLLPPDEPSALTTIGAAGFGVFKAERYFSGDEDGCYHCGSSRSAAVSDRCDFSYPLDPPATSFEGSCGHYCRQESFRTVPTPSEASWNSRSELLPHSSDPVSSKALALSPKKLPSASAAKRWWFWLCCLCIGKESFVVQERYEEQKTPVHPNLESADGFGREARVVRKQGIGRPFCASSAIPEAPSRAEETHPAKMQLVGKWPAKEEMEKEIYPSHALYSSNIHYPECFGSRIVSSAAVPLHDAGGSGFSFPILTKPAPEDPHRQSLEVFCPKEDATPMAAAATEFPRRSFSFQTSGLSAPRQEDDVASDSSADLFEIESFSTQTGAPCHRRDSVDAALGLAVKRLSASGTKESRRDQEKTERASTATASEWGYPPSEVSVQWSVATAEGFDEASVATYASATPSCADAWFAFRAEQERDARNGSRGGTGRGETRTRLSSGLLSRRPVKAVGVKSTKHGKEKSRNHNATNDSRNAASLRNWAGGRGGTGNQDHQLVSRPLQDSRLDRRNTSWITRPIETR